MADNLMTKMTIKEYIKTYYLDRAIEGGKECSLKTKQGLNYKKKPSGYNNTHKRPKKERRRSSSKKA